MANSFPEQELTAMEIRLIEEYLIDLNGVQAYIRAGYESKTYDSARAVSSEILSKPNIRAEIDRRNEQLLARLQATREHTLREIVRLAYFDPRKLFEDDGSPKKIKALGSDEAAAIAGLEVVEYFEPNEEGKKRQVGWIKKYKFNDKNAALDKLMRYHALYHDPGSSKENPVHHAVQVVYENAP